MSVVFDPERAARVLDALPALRGRLKRPVKEGVESVAFTEKRITKRQIYRLFATPTTRTCARRCVRSTTRLALG
jgi:hypothetical protein